MQIQVGWKVCASLYRPKTSCPTFLAIFFWLVVSTPLKNMSSSVGMNIPNMYIYIYGKNGKIKAMSQTTNQMLYVFSCFFYVFVGECSSDGHARPMVGIVGAAGIRIRQSKTWELKPASVIGSCCWLPSGNLT